MPITSSKKYQFKRVQRLLNPTDYQLVFKKSIRSSDRFLTIIARKTVLDNSRLGLAISKKAIKTAVQRNRIKRLTREFFRLRKNKIGIADYVVMAKNGLDKQSNQVIRDSLSKQFNYLRKKLK